MRLSRRSPGPSIGERRAAGGGERRDGDIEERPFPAWPSECQKTNGTPP